METAACGTYLNFSTLVVVQLFLAVDFSCFVAAAVSGYASVESPVKESPTLVFNFRMIATLG
jgi:hypothetical protein